MKKIFNTIQSWVSHHEKIEKEYKKVLAAKVVLHFCQTSIYKEQFAAMLDTMMDGKTVDEFLESFDVTQDGEEIVLSLKNEPEEEDLEPIVIARFNSSKLNDFTGSLSIN